MMKCHALQQNLTPLHVSRLLAQHLCFLRNAEPQLDTTGERVSRFVSFHKLKTANIFSLPARNRTAILMSCSISLRLLSKLIVVSIYMKVVVWYLRWICYIILPSSESYLKISLCKGQDLLRQILLRQSEIFIFRFTYIAIKWPVFNIHK